VGRRRGNGIGCLKMKISLSVLNCTRMIRNILFSQRECGTRHLLDPVREREYFRKVMLPARKKWKENCKTAALSGFAVDSYVPILSHEVHEALHSW